jgi:hypothetical protein
MCAAGSALTVFRTFEFVFMIYWPFEFHKLLPKGWLKPAELGWLVPKALRAYAMLAKHRFTVENRQGLLLLLDRKSYIDSWLLVRGSWERPQIEYLSSLITRYCTTEEAIFLDVGAHAGLYSLILRKAAKFERIIAFEPDPRNLAQLYANLLMNNATQAVEVLPIALSSFDNTCNRFKRREKHDPMFSTRRSDQR